MKTIHPIHIEPALNGFNVRVGCQALVFESRAALLTNLARYLENPEGVEKEFIANAVNQTHSPLAPPPPPSEVFAANRRDPERYAGAVCASVPSPCEQTATDVRR